MGHAKVSVIMAVYNAEKYLRKALDTIVNQTLRDIEIILVDDLSTDGSYDIMCKFAEEDGRIIILRHTEKTAGAAAARNMGLRLAKGEYLSFLDADDWFELDMLEKAYHKAICADADLVIYDGWKYYESSGTEKYVENSILRKKFLPKRNVFSPNFCGSNLFRIQMGVAWDVLFKRDMIDKYEIIFPDARPDDQGFVNFALAVAHRIAVLPERLVHYRVEVKTSQSYNSGKDVERVYIATLRLMENLERKGIYRNHWQAVANLALQTSEYYLGNAVDFEKFKEMHALLVEYLPKFSVEKLLPEHQIYPELNKWRDLILSGKAEDVIDEYYLPRMMDKESARLLSGLPWGDRIVIYGAGDRGKQVFKALLGFKWCKVVNWVDKAYKAIGYPVSNPEILREGGFDSVLVAVESWDVYCDIRSYLQSIGLERRQIIWLFRNV